MTSLVHLDVLDRIGVASPCTADWSSMRGDDQVRFCSQCSLHVYNLSAMSRDEALRLVHTTDGRLCARFFRRADGTLITRDCPVGLRALRMKAARAAGRLAAAIACLIGGGVFLGWGRAPVARLRAMEPFATISRWIGAPPAFGQVQVMMGDICPPPRPAPGPKR